MYRKGAGVAVVRGGGRVLFAMVALGRFALAVRHFIGMFVHGLGGILGKLEGDRARQQVTSESVGLGRTGRDRRQGAPVTPRTAEG